jgi:DNA mismatch repair protein MutL
MGELLPDLQDYGFALEAVGQTTFVVTATPADVQEANLQPFFEQLLADYKASTLQKFCDRGQSLRAALARQMAARATSPLSQEEMQQLVADLFACPMADTTPGGKRIITIVKPEEIFK